MKLNEIDYSPLYEGENFWDKAVREKFKVSSTVFWLICIFGLGLLFVVFRHPSIVVVPAVLVFSTVAATVQKYRNELWKRFAESNGWGITPGQLATIGFVPPSLLDAGHTRKLGDVVHADIDGHLCSVYAYQFTIGHGKGSKTHHYTIARVLLPKPFPHLLLDGKKSYPLRNKGTANTPVKLEGNFNKFFHLYHAKGEHIDALSIITPDVMQTLIDSNATQDIEIIDNNIYFMIAHDQRNVRQLPILFASVDALSDELVHKSKTLRYDGGNFPGAAHLTQVAAQYFKSGELVMSTLWKILFWVIMVPFIIFVLMGALTSFAGR